MSEWYEAKPDDIEIDIAQSEFNVYVKTNDQRNVYVTIPFKSVTRMYEEICNHERGG